MGKTRDNTRLDREITDLLVNHEQPDILLSAIAQKVGAALAADASWLFIGEAIAVDSPCFSWKQSAEFGLAIPKILASASSLALDRPLIVNNIAALSDSDLPIRALLDESIQALVVASIPWGREIIGYLVLASERADRWNSQDRDRLESILAPIAVAIDKSLNYRRYITLNHYQTILPELSAALAKNLEREQFFRLALSSAAKALELELGLVLLLKYDELPPIKTAKVPKAKVLLAEQWIAPNRPVLDSENSKGSSNFELNECGLLQQAYQNTPEPSIFNSSDSIPESKLSSLYPLRSNWLILPLTSVSRDTNNGGIVLGFLVFQLQQTRTWQPEELALVNLIGTLIGTAIVQSQTLFQVQNLVEERTAQLQSSLEVQAMLYDKTRQQLEQVRQAKKAREEFIDSISHELRTPLTAMNLAIRMLRQPGLADDRRTNYFNILEQQCNQEIALVNDLLDWGRLESKQYEVQVQIVNLCQLLEQLAQSFRDKWTHKGLNLEISAPSPVDLQTDKDILKRILAELLTNAGKYSTEESTIYLRVNLSKSKSQVVLSISNIGSCIPPDEIEHIFEPLRRPAGTARNAIRGTGLGLALVKSFVQHLHGAIAVSSDLLPEDVACQTCFTLTLPQTMDRV